MTRKKAREQAFLLFFEKSFHPEADIEDIAALAFDSGLVENDEYVGTIAKIASEKLLEIDEVIEENLRGWRKTRISKVSLAVLRLALCEMLYIDDVPVSVSINEAVEMCKLYSGDEDASFVNGVLGTVARNFAGKSKGQPEETPEESDGEKKDG